MSVTINNGSVTLTAATSTLVSEAKYSGSIRAVLVVTNTEAAGGSTITIAVGQEAKAANGIILLPGQSFAWALDSGYRPPLHQVNAYSAGTPVLAIYEEIFTRD